jgi:hypothetical protein
MSVQNKVCELDVNIYIKEFVKRVCEKSDEKDEVWICKMR